MTCKLIKTAGTWRDVADAARTTVGMEPGTGEPRLAWKRSMLLAEHSPIRKLIFNWKWYDLPYWVSVHFVRHKFGIEQIVFDADTSLAGTIDILLRDPADGTVVIGDWKTNEKIEFGNRFGTHGLAPIAHLEDCSAVHYGLQLSTYEFLMKKAGYFPRDQRFRRTIFHLTDDGPKPYELPDYSIEVRDMVIAHMAEPPF